MHMRMAVPVVLFLGGVGSIAAAVLLGEAEVSLFLIFPVFTGSSGLFLLGIVLIILSFVTGFMFMVMGQLELADLQSQPPKGAEDVGWGGTERRFGGVVMIGPVPIAFGSDRKMALAMLVAGIVVAIVALVVIVLVFGQ